MHTCWRVSENHCHRFAVQRADDLLEAVQIKSVLHECWIHLAKEFVIVPFCDNKHWAVVVVCNPGAKDCTALKLCSMGIEKMYVWRTLDDYLAEEWKAKVGEGRNSAVDGDVSRVDSGVWKILHNRTLVHMPRQENGVDCGLFVLYYMQRFVREFATSEPCPYKIHLTYTLSRRPWACIKLRCWLTRTTRMRGSHSM